MLFVWDQLGLWTIQCCMAIYFNSTIYGGMFVLLVVYKIREASKTDISITGQPKGKIVRA